MIQQMLKQELKIILSYFANGEKMCYRVSALPRFVYILTFLLSGPYPAETRAQSDKAPGTIPYTIHPNDILEIFVWKEPELSRKILVRPDGKISVPLLQDLDAAGKAPAKLKEEIESRLKQFLTSPNVTVIVDTIQSYKIYVIGKVQNPNAYTPEKPVSVLQALTLAGGFQEYANKSQISVIRTLDKGPEVFRFDYDDVIRGRQMQQNIILESGDVVVVP